MQLCMLRFKQTAILPISNPMKSVIVAKGLPSQRPYRLPSPREYLRAVAAVGSQRRVRVQRGRIVPRRGMRRGMSLPRIAGIGIAAIDGIGGVARRGRKLAHPIALAISPANELQRCCNRWLPTLSRSRPSPTNFCATSSAEALLSQVCPNSRPQKPRSAKRLWNRARSLNGNLAPCFSRICERILTPRRGWHANPSAGVARKAILVCREGKLHNPHFLESV